MLFNSTNELFFVVPSKQNNFQEKPIFQALKEAKTDHFGLKISKLFLIFLKVAGSSSI
jgi:hypothetical protein